MGLWQQVSSSKMLVFMYGLYYGTLTFGGWWIWGNTWWYLYVRHLDFYQRNAFMAFRDEAMMWTFLVLISLRLAVFFVSWLVPQILHVFKVRLFSITLAPKQKLSSIFASGSLGSQPRDDKEAIKAVLIPPTTTDDGAQDHMRRDLRDQNAEVYTKFDARDRKAQKQATEHTLKTKPRRSTSLGWNFAPGQTSVTSEPTSKALIRKGASGLPSLLASWRSPGNPPQRYPRGTPPVDRKQLLFTETTFGPKQHLIRRTLSEGELKGSTVQPVTDDDDWDDDYDGPVAEVALRYRAICYKEMKYWFERIQDWSHRCIELGEQYDQSEAEKNELQILHEDHLAQSKAEKNELQTQKAELQIQHEDQLAQSKAEKSKLQTQHEDHLAQSTAEKDKLQIQYDFLQQKYYSADRFTAKHPVWLLVRVRRLLNDDSETGAPPLTEFKVSFTAKKLLLTCRQGGNSTSDSFEIDHYIGPSSTNRDVYRGVEPLMEILFSGYDVCIFTDGQSGSGKSWTMFKGNDAIAPSIALSVMTWKTVGAAQGWTRKVHCSAIEIYRDRLKDLLVGNGDANVEISKAKNGHCDRPAESVEELIDLFQRAYKNLEIKQTHENRESSRGHFFCSLILAQSQPGKPSVQSRITLVDLAGGERTQTGAQNPPLQTTGVKKGSSSAAADEADSSLTAETKFINSSRGALRTFMQEMKKSKRGSAVCEFTRYLKLVLENNPRLIYLAHLDPLSDQYGRTLDTLKYAKELRC